MRLLIATDSFPPKVDGVSDTARRVAEMLATRGHEVRVIAPAPRAFEGRGYRVARIKSVACPLYPELRLGLDLPRVARIARRGEWDGAIVLTPGPIGATAATCLPRSVPLLNIYTTDIPGYMRTYGLDLLVPKAEAGLRWMANRATATLSPTWFVQEQLERRGYPRLEVWGRGVDTELFNPGRQSAEMRRRLGSSSEPLAIFVGRLAREKNVQLLAQVMRLVPNLKLAVVGDGPDRSDVEAAFAGLPVVFTGYLRGVELASAFASADMFLFPSESETFGQVVLQAMACGVPPIVIEGSAPAELVPAGVAGLHVAPARPEAMARAAQSLIECPAWRASMSVAAVERARSFSWDALADRLEGLLSPRWSTGRRRTCSPR